MRPRTATFAGIYELPTAETGGRGSARGPVHERSSGHADLRLVRAQNLLVVTDSPGVTAAIEAAAAHGPSVFGVVVADTCTEALNALQGGRFSVCVVDTEVAGGAGVALVHAASRRFPTLPFVVCSERDDPERDGDALTAGAAGYIPLRHAGRSEIRRTLRYALAAGERERAAAGTLETIAGGMDGGLWAWDFRAGTVWLSPQVAAWTNLGEHQRVSDQLFAGAFARTDALAIAQARRDLVAGRRTQIDCVVRVRGSGGRWLRISGAVRDADVGQLGGAIVECADPRMSAHHSAAYFDRMTGLASDRLFFDRVEQACAGPDPDVALVCFAIAPVGGALGSTAGDEALIESAARLDELSGPTDCVGRTGPRELMMLMRGSAATRMVGMARCGVQALTTPVQTASGVHHLLVHAGCVAADVVSTDPVELVQASRFAATEAVSARSSVDCRALRSNSRAAQLTRLELDFRRAVARGELYLEYQPISKRGDLTVVSYEALARWRHADLGPISPRHFFELAARTSLLGEIGRQLTTQACRAAAGWGRDGEAPQLHINVSCAQLLEHGFADAVATIVREAKLPASRVRLELPDADAALDSPAARRQIRRLARDGFFVEADASPQIIDVLARDSIASAFRGLKLVPGSVRSGASADGVRELVDRGHSLGLRMTATGIETQAQLGLAQTAGADALQGYFVGHPTTNDRLHGRPPSLLAA